MEAWSDERVHEPGGLSRYCRRGAAVALASAGLLVVACGGGGGGDVPGGDVSSISVDEGSLPVIEMAARWAWGDAERLDTLIGSADVVFSGTVVTLKGQRPVLTTPEGTEPGAPVPHFADLPVSQFEVRLEAVVSGNLTQGAAVTLEQIGGVEMRPDGTRARIMLKGDEPFQVGQKYLFFGSFQQDGTITVPPFGRMKVRPNGSLVAEAGWERLGALEELSRGNLGDAERQISATAGD